MATGGQNNLCQRGVCVVQCVLQAVSTVHTPQKDGLLSASKFTKGSKSAQDNLRSLLRNQTIIIMCRLRRSHWPRGLRRRSAVARLLRLWVRILSLVSVVFYQVEVSASG